MPKSGFNNQKVIEARIDQKISFRIRLNEIYRELKTKSTINATTIKFVLLSKSKGMPPIYVGIIRKVKRTIWKKNLHRFPL